MCKILNISIESEKEYLEKTKLEDFLKKNQIEFDDFQCRLELFKKYAQFRLGDKYTVQ